jgi:hypothetical protein
MSGTQFDDILSSKSSSVERFFEGLGNIGLGSPTTRFVFGTVVTGLAVWAIRPEVAFDGNGVPRSWKPMSSDSGATLVPWWVWALTGGVVFSTFI